MRSRTALISIAAVIVIPLIFALLGASHDAGLALGIVLVVVGVAWGLVGARGGAPDED